jgi:hypothetical protein
VKFPGVLASTRRGVNPDPPEPTWADEEF